MLKNIMLAVVSDLQVLAIAHSVFSTRYINGRIPAYGVGMMLLNRHTNSLTKTIEGLNHEAD